MDVCVAILVGGRPDLSLSDPAFQRYLGLIQRNPYVTLS